MSPPSLSWQTVFGNGKTLAKAIASHHTTIEDVGKIANEAKVKKLILSHLVPITVPDETWKQEHRKLFQALSSLVMKI